MSDKMKELGSKMRNAMGRLAVGIRPLSSGLAGGMRGAGTGIIALGLMAVGSYVLYKHPPMQSVGRGEVGMRVNRLTGTSTEVRDGAVLVLPGLHQLRRFSLRDRIYRPAAGASASGPAPFQSVEGLSLGVDISVRYRLDPSRIAAMSRDLPDDLAGEVVEPVVQGVLYKTLAKYTVREIFSTKRQEIQQARKPN